MSVVSIGPPAILRTLRIDVWMAQCNTESVELPALAQIESQGRSLGRRDAMRNLLAAVRSVAATNFESDERGSAAWDVGQEAQRAGVVLEGKARLCIATSELPPGFGDRGNAAGSPELGRLGSGFSCVQFKNDKRKERDDSECRCLR